MKASALPLIAVLILTSCNSEKKSEKVQAQNPVKLISSPTDGNSSLPFLSKDDKNNLILSWVERLEDSAVLKFSTFDSKSWSPPNIISSGTDWFVNWADYPSVVRSGNQMISHFLAKSSPETFSYDVHLTQSGNGGQQWQPDFIPHKDGTLTEHGFVSLLPFEDRFFAAWLDGRNTGGSHGGENHDDEERGAMTIRGAFVSTSGELSGEALLDDRICDCCQTGGAITENGPIIVYRDRSEDEIRDMSIVRYVNGEWTNPKVIYKDDWKIAGCPVNGPSASAIGSSLAVAWFSAANQESEVKVIFSNDNGGTFGNIVIIDKSSPIGRVDVSMIDKTTAIVSWLDKSIENAEFKAALVTSDGQIKNEFTIAEIDPSRKSGFPQMEVINDNFYFAWTELSDNNESTVRIAQLFQDKLAAGI
ncbi:MAG: exo-alpha-sialidase [Cyclobacteriaceae bacterium]